MESATYPLARIQNIQSLCCALGISEPMLRSIVRRASRLYVGPTPKLKKNSAKVRYVFDTRKPLKPLLKRINDVIFKRVNYPSYLTGSLPGKDFVQNVALHTGAKRVITEDIKNFFDNITALHVFQVWHQFFGFGEEVAELLTQLTTKDGKVCQGTPTSSYLANLAFWDREPALVKKLQVRGIRYSRYVDDITISSAGEMTEEDKRWAIAQAYGMVGGAGFKAQRVKHSGASARAAITIMGLNANSPSGPTLSKKERADIRATVFQLEQRIARGDASPEFRADITRAAGRVGRLKRLHPREGEQLTNRLRTIKLALNSMPVLATPTVDVPSMMPNSLDVPF